MKTLLLIIMVMFTMMSCTSKSGQLVANKPVLNAAEKVVIIDRVYTPVGYSDGDPIYRYKVKIINRGVVDFVDLDYLFDTNDTILYQFWNNN